MVKKMFALACVTALGGAVAMLAASGCSTTVTETGEGGVTGDGGGDAKKPTEAGPEVDAAGPPEEGTVGKLCTTTADCKVTDSVNDNVCSIGAFGTSGTNDLFGSPVCIQPKCTQGSGMTVADLLCDGTAGLCLPTQTGSTSGVCLPYCEYDSTTISTKCNGGQKCAIAYGASDSTGKALAIGYCEAACMSDADCKGTAGQKCQVELGQCLGAADFQVFPKAYGVGCDAAATDGGVAVDECNCNSVGGTGVNKDKGVCTRTCITGAAGNAVCAAAVPGWGCTAKLPKVDTAGKPQFTGQPDDIYGQCALPCVDDTTCAALATSTGAPFKCRDWAGGKFCETTDTP